MRTTTTLAALLLLAAFAGCVDRPASPTDTPTASHVFEDLLAALDIETPVGVYESWDNIPDPDLAAELREYAERTESVIECGPMDCTGPGHNVKIRFRDWTWSPPTAPLPVIEDPTGIYESWERALAWFDPIIRNGDGAFLEVIRADGGPLVVVNVTRTDEGEWMVGEIRHVGMVIS